jgi:hypothetical protein
MKMWHRLGGCGLLLGLSACMAAGPVAPLSQTPLPAAPQRPAVHAARFTGGPCPTGTSRMAIQQPRLKGTGWGHLEGPQVRALEKTLARDLAALFKAHGCRDVRVVSELERPRLKGEAHINFVWTPTLLVKVVRHPTSDLYWTMELTLHLGVEDDTRAGAFQVIGLDRWQKDLTERGTWGPLPPGRGPNLQELLPAVVTLYEILLHRAEAALPPSIPQAIDDQTSQWQSAAADRERFQAAPTPTPAPSPSPASTTVPPRPVPADSIRALYERTRPIGPMACLTAVTQNVNVFHFELGQRDVYANYALGEGLVAAKLPLSVSEQLQRLTPEGGRALQVNWDLAFLDWFLKATGLRFDELGCALQYFTHLARQGDAKTVERLATTFFTSRRAP